MSLEHWTAVSLIYKAAGIGQLAENTLRDPLVAALRAKIKLKTDDAVGREAASARIVFKDGKALEATVKDCRGSAGRPLTDDDISVKTLDQLRVAFSAAGRRAHRRRVLEDRAVSARRAARQNAWHEELAQWWPPKPQLSRARPA